MNKVLFWTFKFKNINLNVSKKILLMKYSCSHKVKFFLKNFPIIQLSQLSRYSINNHFDLGKIIDASAKIDLS